MDIYNTPRFYDDIEIKNYVEAGITILNSFDTINKRLHRNILLKRCPLEAELEYFESIGCNISDTDEIICFYDYDYVISQFQKIEETLRIEDYPEEEINLLTAINSQNIIGEEEIDHFRFAPNKWLIQQKDNIELYPYKGVNPLQTQRLLETLWLNQSLNCNGKFKSDFIWIDFRPSQYDLKFVILDGSNLDLISNNSGLFNKRKIRLENDLRANSIIKPSPKNYKYQ